MIRVGRAQDKTWEEEATNAAEHHDPPPDPCPVLRPNWDVILEWHSYRLVGKPNGEGFWPPFALQMQSKLPQNCCIGGTWVVQCDCVGSRWGEGAFILAPPEAPSALIWYQKCLEMSTCPENGSWLYVMVPGGELTPEAPQGSLLG